MTRKLLTYAAAALLTMLSAAQPTTAQVSGAIFTSDSGGDVVNANIYPTKADVYLNGGPPPSAPCSAAGLPDGEYYFQVTDPSGTTLLSTDALGDRRLLVAGGLIVASLGTHAVGSGTCPGAVSVELMPYDDTPNNGGEYKVWATAVADYAEGSGVFGFVNSKSKTDNFKVRERSSGLDPYVTLEGKMFYDANVNGVRDPGEPGIPGWRITKEPPLPPAITFTDPNGCYGFLTPPVEPGEDPREELITQIPPAGSWTPTTPTQQTVVIDSNTSGTVEVPDFGSVCLGAGGGHTIGFWGNRNGQALIGSQPEWLAMLSGLNLVSESGSAFDPASGADLKAWLRNARAVNMAYMLSAQLAAMSLNVASGGVDPGAMIFAPGTASANAAGMATVAAVLAEADAELAAHSTAFTGDPWRGYQSALKDAIDNGNNNQNFVQPPICGFTTPY